MGWRAPAIAVGIFWAALLGYAEPVAAAFFDACLVKGNQTIQVNFDTIVHNQSATLPADGSCTIAVADGVTLRLINVTIPPTNTHLTFTGGATSRLFIRGSNIRACDSDMSGFGRVRISTSTLSDPEGEGSDRCDVKEMFITGGVKIYQSTLQGVFNVDVRSEKGNVTVLRSVMTSGSAGRTFSLQTFSPTSVMRVIQSRLNSAGPVEVNGAGATSVLRSRFDAADIVTVLGDPCLAKKNTPDTIACSTPPTCTLAKAGRDSNPISASAC